MRGKSAKNANKRVVESDRVYQSKLITRLINNIMRDGKKTTAERVVYDACELLTKKNTDPLQAFEKAIQNVGPKQEVKARRIGGANYQVPSEVRGERKVSLAIRWIIAAAESKSNKEFHTFAEKLAAEILDASQNQGNAIKKRDTVQKTADANRAFSHFRF